MLQSDDGRIGINGDVEARSTGSHCGGQACVFSASSLATVGFMLCGTKVTQKAATPTRKNALMGEASFLTAAAILSLVVCLASTCPGTGCLVTHLESSLAAILATCTVVT